MNIITCIKGYMDTHINTNLKQTKPVSAGGAVHTKLTVLLLALLV